MNRFRNKLFVINKECGPTSFEIVEAFRRATALRKVGHTGTLDPAASGVLLVCTDKATRAVELFMDLQKEYEFVVHLGVETSTLDSEGDIVRATDCPSFSVDEIKQATSTFAGLYDMEPPVYSAIKQQGKRLYELARAGQKPTIKRKTVNVYAIEVLDIALPKVTCRVRCSRGTYVRSLARDIGARLGVPAHLASLVRMSIGPFSIDHAFPSNRLFAGDTTDLVGIELASALEFLPGIVLNDGSKRALFDGACPEEHDVLETIGSIDSAGAIRILDEEGQILALGQRGEPCRRGMVDSYRLLVDRPTAT